jgi:hypothetical protein
LRSVVARRDCAGRHHVFAPAVSRETLNTEFIDCIAVIVPSRGIVVARLVLLVKLLIRADVAFVVSR